MKILLLFCLLLIPVIGYGQGVEASRIRRTTFSNLGTPTDSNERYCADCTPDTTPCAGSGTGAVATRVNGAWNCAGTAAGAPADPTFITQTPNATLTNEQALSLLATGIPLITTGTGVISISSVTNDAQTKASIVPNTAPSSGQILCGNAGGTAYAPCTIGTDATLTSTGALTLKNTGTAGTYRSTTFDAQGRETSGTNPTTFSGYALSDTSANLRAALTDELGTGADLFDGATPTSLILTNATGLPLTTGVTGVLPTANIAVALANQTSINGLNITASTGTLSITNGKTLTALKSISFTAADDTGVYTLPTGTKTLIDTTVATLSSLASIGTITSGGLGTGAVIGGVTMTLGSDATGDMYYRNSSGVLTRIAPGAQNTILLMGASSVPAWATEPACATCVTSAAALTLNQLVVGQGSQASATLGSLGTTTTVLHGNAAGAPTFGAIVNADITNSTIDLTAKVTGLLPVANGGSGVGTLTGILKGNGTSAFTAVTAPSGTIVGTTDSQVLQAKQLLGMTNINDTFINTAGSIGVHSAALYIVGALATRIYGDENRNVGVTFTASTNATAFINNGAVSMSIASAGGVTLNTTAYASCTALTTNSSALIGCTASDALLKNIKHPFTRGLDAILGLTPQTYSFKPSWFQYNNGQEYSSLVAQNVQQFIPEAVSRMSGGLQIDNATIISTLVNADKDIKAILLRQQAEIEMLRNAVKILSERHP